MKLKLPIETIISQIICQYVGFLYTLFISIKLFDMEDRLDKTHTKADALFLVLLRNKMLFCCLIILGITDPYPIYFLNIYYLLNLNNCVLFRRACWKPEPRGQLLLLGRHLPDMM